MDLFELEKKLQEKLKNCAELALAKFVANKSSDKQATKFEPNDLFVHYRNSYVQIVSRSKSGNISFALRTNQAQAAFNDPQANFEVYVSESFFDNIDDFLTLFKEMSTAMYKVARADFRKAATGLKNVNVKTVLNQVYFAHDVLNDLGYRVGSESYVRFYPISWAYGIGVDCKINEHREVSLSFFKENIDDVKGHLGAIINKTHANTNVVQIEGDLIQDHENSIAGIYKFIKDAENGNYN